MVEFEGQNIRKEIQFLRRYVEWCTGVLNFLKKEDGKSLRNDYTDLQHPMTIRPKRSANLIQFESLESRDMVIYK
jgi:hypothetical protein